jgi:parvulin-like peptidyl-prolyl isomerase
MEKGKMKKEKKNVKGLTFLYTAILLLILLVVLNGVFIYFFNANNNFEKKIDGIIPYPEAIMGYQHLITFNEVDENLKAVKIFYENQNFSSIGLRVDFSTDDGKKRLKIKEKEILNKMIEDFAVKTIAEKFGVKISDDDVNQEVSRTMKEYGTEDLTRGKLNDLYGWTLEDFKQKVVKPDMYRKEVEKIYAKDDKLNAQPKQKIGDVAKDLKANGDFARTAEKFSEGASAKDGGELGWYKKEQLIQEIADKITSLKKGEKSDIMESSLGFHIVEMEDLKKGETGESLFKIRQIFVAKETFADWLGEKMKGISVVVLAKDFVWNKNSLTVEFSNKDLKNFEDKIKSESPGDASVIF